MKKKSFQEVNFTPFSKESGTPKNDVRGTGRLIVFRLVLVILAVVFIFRLVDMIVVNGEMYSSLADQNFRRYNQIEAPRGEIFDRNGEILATNIPRYALVVFPDRIGKDDVFESLVSNLVEIFPDERSTLVEELIEARESTQSRVLLYPDIQREEAVEIISRKNELVGVEIEIVPRRKYVDGAYFSHIIGYMTEVPPETLDADDYYLAGDQVGRDGIEKSYEQYLRGIKGIGVVDINATGEAITSRSEQGYSPEVGHDITLTIDSEIQKYTTDVLTKAVTESEAKSGVAIMMDVRTGEILSLVTIPTFDNNIFVSPSRRIEISDLYSEDSNNPLFNRATQGGFPPASTFKVFVASAALEEGIITPTKVLQTPGFIDVGGARFRDWIFLQYGGSFGSLDMYGAIARSSDVYFYQVGAGYENQQGLGSDNIAYYAKQFGLGVDSGIDLPSYSIGKVPSQSDVLSAGGEWYWGNTAHMAIGQAYTTVSPLEVLIGISTISNGGDVMKPHLVQSIGETTYEDGMDISSEVLRSGFVSSENLAAVRLGMYDAVYSSHGTAKALANIGVTLGAKTGTAQHHSDKEPHAWFVAFAPYESPEIAVVVLLEEGGEGSQTALPVAGEMLKAYFDLL